MYVPRWDDTHSLAQNLTWGNCSVAAGCYFTTVSFLLWNKNSPASKSFFITTSTQTASHNQWSPGNLETNIWLILNVSTSPPFAALQLWWRGIFFLPSLWALVFSSAKWNDSSRTACTPELLWVKWDDHNSHFYGDLLFAKYHSAVSSHSLRSGGGGKML